jgi:glycosyltransferase involved in cell wall biosynthesis
MKIAFISRATLFTVPGGDTRQMEMTAKYLRKLSVQVDIFLTTDSIDYSSYDLIHFYNITRPADILRHIRLSKKPYVVSTIFVQHDRINEEQKGRLFKMISRMFSVDGLAYLKTVARWIKNGEKIISKKYLWLGQRRSIEWIVNNAEFLLPNSESEMRRFFSHYIVDCPYHVVPNGIDPEILNRNIEKDEKYVQAIICLARFEPLKNQLNLIKALNNSPYQVYLHGKPSPNNVVYYEQCVQEAGPNIHIGGWLEEDETYRVYASAKVHVLASHFETTGLSSLEAAVMGCNIVVTDRGDTRDYFRGDAWYCEPDDIQSIRSAVDAAYTAMYNDAFKQRILTDYTWQRAAEETLKAYRQVLKL